MELYALTSVVTSHTGLLLLALVALLLGMSVLSEDTWLKNLRDLGIADAEGLPRGLGARVVKLAAATQALTAAMCGTKFVGAVDAVFTLPAAAAATKGVWYEFECGALSAGVGLSVSPAAADAIGGNGLTSVVNKDLINTGATDRLGDSVRIYCTGVTGTGAWIIEGVVGTFAKEA